MIRRSASGGSKRVCWKGKGGKGGAQFIGSARFAPGVCALLVGVLSAVTKRQPVSASGTFGAMQVHAGAGGFVLAGVAGFSAAVAITTQWIRFRKRTTHFTGEENEK